MSATATRVELAETYYIGYARQATKDGNLQLKIFHTSSCVIRSYGML